MDARIIQSLRAGSSKVLHLHGELSRPYCEACRRPYAQSAAIPELPPVGARIEPPRCDSCGAREAAARCEVFLCCGTSALVQPAASLVDIAIDAGATTVQVNPNPTDLDASVTLAIRGPSGVVLPQLVAETWPGAGHEGGPLSSTTLPSGSVT